MSPLAPPNLQRCRALRLGALLRAFASLQKRSPRSRAGNRSPDPGPSYRRTTDSPPVEVKGIVIERQYRITISGKNAVEEHWSSTPVRNASGDLHMAVSSTDSQRALGEEGATVAWHVVGPNALQRISQGKQFIVVMRFQFDDRKKTCSLDARFVEQQGFDFVVMRRADNGQLADFTLDRVLSTTCKVE